jgi:hypothetical protein
MKRKAFAISALAVSAALIAGAALAQQGLKIAIAVLLKQRMQPEGPRTQTTGPH